MPDTKLLDHVFDGLGEDLREYGVKVNKVKGWKRRGVSGIFIPQGNLNHHTASTRASGNAPSLRICTFGRGTPGSADYLPGPLCNFHGARNGTISFVAKGRANHAGLGGPTRGIPEDSGNAYLFGCEFENDGVGEPWGDALYDSMVILNAFLMIRLKKDGAWMSFDHREWTERKIDRSNIDSDLFRADVKRQMVRIRKDGYPSIEGKR